MTTSVYLPLFASILATCVVKSSCAPDTSANASAEEIASAAVASAQSAKDESLKHAQKAIDTLKSFDAKVNASCVNATMASLAKDAFWPNLTSNEKLLVKANAMKECFKSARKADKKKLEELKTEAKKSYEAFKKAGLDLTDALKQNGTAEKILEQIHHNISKTTKELERSTEHAKHDVEKSVEHFYKKAEKSTEAAAHKLDKLVEAKNKLEKEVAKEKKEAEKKAEDAEHKAEGLAKEIADLLGGNTTKKSNNSNPGKQGEQLEEIDARHVHIAFVALAAIASAFAMVFVVVKKHHGIVDSGSQAPPFSGRSPFEYPASSSGKACTISYDGVEVRV